MKHQQFENWIVLEERLDQDQQRELHLHLKGCSHCQSLYQSIHQLDHLFRTAPEPDPAPDFSARWLDRIQKAEKRRNRLILGSTLGAISLATIALLAIVGLEVRLAVDFFPQMLLQLITTIAEWLVFLGQLSNILTPLVRVGTKMITPLWLYFLVFSLGGTAVVWIINNIRLRTIQKEIN